MKRILFAVFVVLFISKTFSQITLEKRYVFNNTNCGQNPGSNSCGTFLGVYTLSNDSKYCYLDGSNIVIYNSNNTFYKNILVPNPTFPINNIESGEKELPLYISESLFNTDNQIEYLRIYQTRDTLNSNRRNNFIRIFNESGTTIFSLDSAELVTNKNSNQIYDGIINTPNGTKMILHNLKVASPSNLNNNPLYTGFSVYSLPGSLLTDIEKQNVTEDKSFLSNPFPNPANEYAAIFYKLPELKTQGNILIYDINGKQVQNIKVDGSNEYILFNNINLSNGTYFYSLIVDNEILDSKKMIIAR